MKLILTAVIIGIGVLISRFVKYICPLISIVCTLAFLGLIFQPKTIPDIPGRLLATIAIFIASAVVGRLTFDLGERLIRLNEQLAVKMEPWLTAAEQQNQPYKENNHEGL